MATLLYRMGRWIAAHRLPVLAAWLVIAIGLVVLVGQVGADTSNNLTLPGTDSQKATDLLASRFPPQQNGQNPIVFHATSGKVTDAANKQAILDSQKALLKLPYVVTATSPFSQQGAAQLSKDKTVAFIPVLLSIGSADLEESQARAVLDAADPGEKAGMQVAAGGSVGSALSTPATESSEVIGIVAAMIILSFAFGTIVAMGMPILSAIIGLLFGLSAIGLIGHLIQVPDIAPTLAIMIGLGVGIDYALFLVSRHRFQVMNGMDVRESIALAVGKTGSAIVFAGGTVIIALLSLAVAGIPLVSSLGYSSAVAVLTAVLAAVTLLPALLSLVGRHIESLALPAFMRPKQKEPGAGFWYRWARWVTSHPWLAVGVAAVILIPLVIPVFWLNLGQEDIAATPKDTTERQAYDLIAQGFGVGYNGPFLIATELGSPATANPTVTAQENQLDALQKELDQEQKEGQAQQAQLESESAGLKAQQAQLESQQASLTSQANALQARAAALERQAAPVKAQAASLQSQRDALRRQAQTLRGEVQRLLGEARALGPAARKLVTTAAGLERRAQALAARQSSIAAAIGASQDPARTAALQRELARLKSEAAGLKQRAAAARAQAAATPGREGPLRRQAATIRTQATSLAAQAERFAAQARTVAGEAAGLERQKLQLEAQAAGLARQAAALQAQAASLQRQAAALEEQQAQLEQLQKTASAQQQQAIALKNELTKELTKAGGDDRGTDPRLVKLQDALAATPGVALMSPPQINKSGNAAVYSLVPTTAPAATETVDLVGTVRDTVIPQATEGEDVQAFVGGSTASNVDLAAEITDKLPLVIAVVLVLSMLVLLLAFRSLAVPLQAAATNIVCVAASFGVMTALFQWGWGISLLHIDTSRDTVPIASYVPLMMFAVLFGLSMDYQVFLLSQVDQHRAAGEGDRESVLNGLAVAARVITAAALIMIAVFGSFILNGDPTVKQFGVGLAVAVALAATMVMLLAPAVLVLLGRATWWMPGWLGRALPKIDIEGEGLKGGREAIDPPAPEPAPARD